MCFCYSKEKPHWRNEGLMTSPIQACVSLERKRAPTPGRAPHKGLPKPPCNFLPCTLIARVVVEEAHVVVGSLIEVKKEKKLLFCP